MGGGEAYILILPLFFWCVDTSLGAHAGILFLFSSFVANGLKDLFKQPRPFQILPSVKLADATGYGLPSFHALEAVIMWGMFAMWLKKRWFWALAVSMMILIGFSRIYLGVHYPTDVLAAYALGAAGLWLYAEGGPTFENWLKGLDFKWQVMLAVIGPAVLAISHPTLDVILVTSALSGFSLGLALFYRYLLFDAEGPVWQRVARFAVGDLVIVVLYGLPALFSVGSLAAFHLPLRYLHYGVIGFWITFGGPWLFLKLGLASAVEKKPANGAQEVMPDAQ